MARYCKVRTSFSIRLGGRVGQKIDVRMIEPVHYASDAGFAAVAAFWELSERSFPAAVVPPPLVPVVLHAAAEDPTADLRAVRHPVARARLLVPLLPGVTLRMQRSAAGAIYACSQDYYADGCGRV